MSNQLCKFYGNGSECHKKPGAPKWCVKADEKSCKHYPENEAQEVATKTALGTTAPNTIRNIEIIKLHPHRDNPRKDLGDMSELAESIKSKGILQNLTVVPWNDANPGEGITGEAYEDAFTVIIGHRRLAAAKLAGLIEVPCVVTKMSKHDQVATMLLENIQRSDLTIYEQAQGFQMMMDLGDSVNEIAERTGFSKVTVQRRIKLLELDANKFKKSVERGATLMDYAELDKIKDVKRKNKVLDYIGTSDFKWQLNSAIEEEQRPIRKEKLIKELDEFAKRAKDSKGLEYVTGFYNFNKHDWKKPKDSNKTEYFYTVDQSNITLYKKPEKASAKKLSPEEKAFHEKEAQIKDLTARAYEMRYEFVKDFTATKEYSKEIAKFVIKQLLAYGSFETNQLQKMLGIEMPDNLKNKNYWSPAEIFELISGEYSKNPERVMLITAYLRTGDCKSNKYYSATSWDNKVAFQKNENLDGLYDALIELGYEMSDEERELKDGSHKLFVSSNAG
jgi:ParB family chromosome partitioning protein